MFTFDLEERNFSLRRKHYLLSSISCHLRSGTHHSTTADWHALLKRTQRFKTREKYGFVDFCCHAVFWFKVCTLSCMHFATNNLWTSIRAHMDRCHDDSSPIWRILLSFPRLIYRSIHQVHHIFYYPSRIFTIIQSLEPSCDSLLQGIWEHCELVNLSRVISSALYKNFYAVYEAPSRNKNSSLATP